MTGRYGVNHRAKISTVSRKAPITLAGGPSMEDRPFGVPLDVMLCEACGVLTSSGRCDCTKAGLTTQRLKPYSEKPKKRHKYGVAPVEQRTVDGIVFASAAEARRYGELKLLERGGFIRKLELQPVYAVEVNGKPICKYVADFCYFEGSERVVEDIKGMQTPEFKLKRKLVEALYPGLKIRIVPA